MGETVTNLASAVTFIWVAVLLFRAPMPWEMKRQVWGGGGYAADGHPNLRQLLDDGWEPFAVDDGEVYLRRRRARKARRVKSMIAGFGKAPTRAPAPRPKAA